MLRICCCAAGALAVFAAGCRDKGTWSIPWDQDREGDAVRTEPVGMRPPESAPPTLAQAWLFEPCPPLCALPVAFPVFRKEKPNPIPAENARAGDPGWRAGRQANAGEVELYLSADSVEVGTTVKAFVSTDAPRTVTAEVYRMGEYGGAGARRVLTLGPFQVAPQASCPRDPLTSRVECAWGETFAFAPGPDWVSGIYLVRVSRPDGYRRFHPFVLRDDRRAEILYQPALLTYQAYNTWGGESLYSDASGTMPNGRAYQVSFNRPYRDDEGTGQLLRWELHVVRLLERYGYDVTYATNLDFLRRPNLLEGIAAFVNGGHDEYWPVEEREQVEAAVASGMSFVHFGGNAAYWRSRVLSDASGNPLRTVACYKNEPWHDPVPFSTIRFRDDPGARPENGLLGAMYDGWQLISFPLVVADSSHWLFQGTNLQAKDQLDGLVGYEFDRLFDNGLTPSGLSTIFDSPAVTAEGVPGAAQATVRSLPAGNVVFSAGTIYWALGLGDDAEFADWRVARITLNALERALARRRPARPPPPLAPRVPPPAVPVAQWAASVNPFAGIPGPAGNDDGPGATARFDGPTGLATTPDGKVVVADTGGNRIRLVDNDPARTVSTVAGTGVLGGVDGPGRAAMFRRPTGVAVGSDGSIYVADSDNHVIRRIADDPPTWTVTTYAGAMRVQGFADGPGPSARFRRPTALAIDPAGNLYVADQAGNRIRKVAAGTRDVTTIAGTGSGGYADDPQGLVAKFNNPSGVAVSGGTLFVFDSGNQVLRRISPGGTNPVTRVAGRLSGAMGFADGSGDQARFRAQLGLAVSASGEVWIADTGNFRVRKAIPGADASATWVYTVAGSGRTGTRTGAADQSDLVAPAGLAFLADGSAVVSDSYNNVIRLIRQ